ncbi:hypothetical protein [Ligilactobacillus sp. 110_WCHN]|uniref:hypothetical protein n=1 Tax=Ligilactobacillus sp. 110_WCHN TaxID=3057125 RepID=UPI0026726497|nr:hypothetical protein [Ligilactobacillus sp. 110_WCHN]MDO3394050.1 hypothetical protein [Ligilactobacillus sp. 110_WCHN]
MNKKLKIHDTESSEDKIVIRKYQDQRLTFNFSFLTADKAYNLTKCDKKVKSKLIERIENLSQEDVTAVLNRTKEVGLEKIPNDEITGLRIHNVFKDTRESECNKDFWVFRLSSLGRVIGKMNKNIFYILAIDTKFKLYDHGS